MKPAFGLARRLAAEALGTALLVATVVGSGTMAQSLTADVALMLLGNTVATGAVLVGLYITAAYWFTASTSFANPAVAAARALTDNFAGIRPTDLPGFMLAQLAGALCAAALAGWLLHEPAEHLAPLPLQAEAQP